MAVLQISKKGQILIPKKIREKAGLKPGGAAQIVENDQELVIRAVPADPIAAATGFLDLRASLTRELLQEHRRESRREQKTGSR
jgi:AbrB family looped-hinge helix DNA binding protein